WLNVVVILFVTLLALVIGVCLWLLWGKLN
ncbi:unnamed protein product, partial [marine sediment metagenome]